MPFGLSDIVTINPHLLQYLDLSKSSPWAVLLCKFSGDPSATAALDHYKQLFTGSGAGTMNMSDFFSDMSHGNINTSGSEVLGWYTLSRPKSDYAGNVGTPPAGKFNRNGLFDLCRQAATNAGVDLSKFAGVVVSMAGAVDLFGYVGGMAAFCDSFSLQPSLLGQEMGHGYGLDHARRDGSTEDYQDPWDVMSTAKAYEQADSNYEFVGPGLNAWNMRSRGWLLEGRVWHGGAGAFDRTVQLRPLHRRDLPGSLAAEVGPYLVEFRMKERWDAAIPRSCVLIHRFADNHSYVMAGTAGNFDLVAGHSFQNGIEGFPFSDFIRVEVTSIDESDRTATLHISHRPAEPIPHFEIGGRVFGGVAVDGGGFIVIGGQFIPVPPRGPEQVILQQSAAYIGMEQLGNMAVRSAARQSALVRIVDEALKAAAALDPLTETPPLKQGNSQ